MSKLGCECGNTIFDQTDEIPYKGYILVDQVQNVLFDTVKELVDSYISASKDVTLKEAWFEKYFLKNYPKNLSPGDMIHDLVHAKFCDLFRYIYQCEECGRILIEHNDDSIGYLSFKPENDFRNVLNA